MTGHEVVGQGRESDLPAVGRDVGEGDQIVRGERADQRRQAEMEIAQGKSPAMKTMARQIIAAQKKEIAAFDAWLAKQK